MVYILARIGFTIVFTINGSVFEWSVVVHSCSYCSNHSKPIFKTFRFQMVSEFECLVLQPSLSCVSLKFQWLLSGIPLVRNLYGRYKLAAVLLKTNWKPDSVLWFWVNAWNQIRKHKLLLNWTIMFGVRHFEYCSLKVLVKANNLILGV